jgi:hypothetical protein
VVFIQYRYPKSKMLSLMLQHVPDYMRWIDEEQTDPLYPLGWYMDLMARQTDPILNATASFDYIPAVDGVEGYERSTLVDASYYPTPEIAEERWLPWLAFITATRTINKITTTQASSTPWYILETLASPYSTWTDINGLASVGSFATWDDLENYNTEAIATSVGYQQSIRTRGTGVLAGTVDGLKRAARLVLTGGLDAPVAATRASNVVTLNFSSLPTITVGTQLEVYDCADDTLSGVLTVTAVNGDTGTVTGTGLSGDDITEPCAAWATNNIVTVTRSGQWGLVIGTQATQSPPGATVLAAVELAKPAGCILTHTSI